MATQVTDTSKNRIRGGSADELAVIAQRAQSFTNASGTAIALSEGSVDEIICRARAGSNAPEVGTSLRVEGTFTGLCIQSGKELRCDDAETDTRVDTAAIRALGIRSMVVVPIRDEGRVAGVLAVFAPTAHAFTITHVAVLKTMGDQIAAYLQRERKSGGHDEGYSPEPLRATPVAPAPRPVPAPATPTPVVPAPRSVQAPAAPTPVVPPVVIKPSTASRPQVPVVSKVEPLKPSVMAEEVAPAAPKKKASDVREQPKDSRPEYRINFGTLDAAAGSSKRRVGNTAVLGGVAAAVIVAVGVASYIMLRKPAAPSPAVQQSLNTPSTATAPVNPQPAPVNSQPAPVVTASNTSTSASPASTGTAAVVPPSAPPTRTESAKKADKTPAKNTPASTQARREEAPVKQEEPQPKQEQTIALSANPSRISAVPDNSAPAADATPAMSLGNAQGSGALSNLASPVSASTPSVLTQSELEPVTVLKKVAPVYPLVAKQRRLSGTVVVQGMVSTEGRITGLELLSGPPVFRDSAFDAVKQWVFKPAKLNGKPIEQPTKISLYFGAQ